MNTADNAVTVFPGGVVSRAQQQAFTDADARIAAAITEAKRCGVPQGLIVAMLHGHAHSETSLMVAKD